MPFDMNQFVEAATAFKTALDGLKIIKGLRGVAGDKAAEDKVSELQRVILVAQQGTLAAQTSQLDMHQEIGELKEKIVQFETWNSEKARYELRDVNAGHGSVYVWALRAEAAGSEPFHLLCAKCFEHRRRSILQGTPELRMRRRVHVCHECKSEYVFGSLAALEAPAKAITEYDPFAPERRDS
jgi:hypothetical protein